MPAGRYTPQVGDWVKLKGLAQTGQVTEINPERKEAAVQVGSLNWRLPWNKLEPGEPPIHLIPPPPSIQISSTSGSESYELDLHGLRVHEAIESVDKFIDTAVVSRLGLVKIIHGHGSGKVRKAVRDYLSRNPHVRDFHFGDPAQGGLAVTVVHLK